MLRRKVSRCDPMIGAEANPPVDRPNLSKGLFAGSMPEDWLWLMPETY